MLCHTCYLFCIAIALVGQRPTTPGDASTVFCLLVEGEPVGNAFVISSNKVLTAKHNLEIRDEDNKIIGYHNKCGLCQRIVMNLKTGGYETDVILSIEVICENTEEDWAVLLLKDGLFKSVAAICQTPDLPQNRDIIGIRDFEIGLLTTESSNALQAGSSGLTKVAGYENRCSPPSSPEHPRSKKVKAVGLSNLDGTQDAIKTDGGRSSGSCGAPYFSTAGSVVAFHVRSINDSDSISASLSDSHSHNSKSVGYVLCQLPKFCEWYNSGSL